MVTGSLVESCWKGTFWKQGLEKMQVYSSVFSKMSISGKTTQSIAQLDLFWAAEYARFSCSNTRQDLEEIMSGSEAWEEHSQQSGKRTRTVFHIGRLWENEAKSGMWRHAAGSEARILDSVSPHFFGGGSEDSFKTCAIHLLSLPKSIHSFPC